MAKKVKYAPAVDEPEVEPGRETATTQMNSAEAAELKRLETRARQDGRRISIQDMTRLRVLRDKSAGR